MRSINMRRSGVQSLPNVLFAFLSGAQERTLPFETVEECSVIPTGLHQQVIWMASVLFATEMLRGVNEWVVLKRVLACIHHKLNRYMPSLLFAKSSDVSEATESALCGCLQFYYQRW